MIQPNFSESFHHVNNSRLKCCSSSCAISISQNQEINRKKTDAQFVTMVFAYFHKDLYSVISRTNVFFSSSGDALFLSSGFLQL